MSDLSIETAEKALKACITQKDGVGRIVGVLHELSPLAGSAYGYDDPVTEKVTSALQRCRAAHRELRRATVEAAGAIHLMAEADARAVDERRAEAEAQRSLFDQEPTAEPLALPAATLDSPRLAPERTRPGGDAHDSFSLDRFYADGEALPALRGCFEQGGARYVAVAMSPGHWVEAHELLPETAEIEGQGLVGTRAALAGEVVVLGHRVRFVAEELPPGPCGDGAIEEIEPEEIEAEPAVHLPDPLDVAGNLGHYQHQRTRFHARYEAGEDDPDTLREEVAAALRALSDWLDHHNPRLDDTQYTAVELLQEDLAGLHQSLPQRA